MPRKKIVKLPQHVYLKDKKWYVGLNFPTNARLKDGRVKYQQINRRCFPETEDRAKEIIAQIRADRTKQAENSPTNPHQTLNRFIELFLAAKKKSLSRRTFDFYTTQFEQHIKENEFGALILSKIKPLDVQYFYDSLKCADKKTAASADAVRKLHQFLSAALNQAVRWETLAKNPAKAVILPKKEKSTVAAFSKEETKKFLETCRKSNDYIVFEFALETGMRPEEYLALTWNDIDFENQTVEINKAIAFNFKGGGFDEKDTKTVGSTRTLKFSAEMAGRLNIHRIKQIQFIKSLKEKLTAAKKETIKNFKDFNLIFPATNGKPWSRLNLNRRTFKAALKLAGLDETKFSLYSLRRTAATLLASKINPRELADFLGHTDISTAMKYYVKTSEDSKTKASNALAEMFY